MGLFSDNPKHDQRNEMEERLKTDFVTLSSHQLRTPLSAVKWFTEILLTERFGKMNKKQLDYLKEIHRSNERAIALVNDLLQVSRVEEGKLHMDYTKIDMPRLIEEVIDANKSSLQSDNITYNFEIINGPIPPVTGDKIKIRRVIQNVFSNAVKYTQKHGRIDMALKRHEKNVVFSVKDSGVGIPADQQEHIFEKFFRGSNAARIQTDGTGLGLYIARSLIEAHGGKIWFESQEGQGSTFYFSLPIGRKGH